MKCTPERIWLTVLEDFWSAVAYVIGCTQLQIILGKMNAVRYVMNFSLPLWFTLIIYIMRLLSMTMTC